MKLAALVMVATLAGCPDRQPSCATSLSQLGERIIASVHTDLERDLTKRFVELAQERCTDDGWSRAVRMCVRNAASYADFDLCAKQMTSSQRQALNRPNK